MTRKLNAYAGMAKSYAAHLLNPLVALATLIIAGLWGATYFQLATERDRLEESVASSTANLALAFERHVSYTFEHIDQNLKFLRSFYSSRSDALPWPEIINANYPTATFIAQLSVIGADGHSITGSVSLPNGQNFFVGDRPHFMVHTSPEFGDRSYVSVPVIGRASGKPSVQLTRSFTTRAGKFGGVLVASLNPHELTAEYDKLSLGQGGGVVLVGSDGIVRAGSGAFKDKLGKSLPDITSPLNVKAGDWVRATTALVWRQPNGSGQSVVATRLVDGQPLTAMVIASDDLTASAWDDLVASRISFAIMCSLVIIGAFAATLFNQMKLKETLLQRKALEVDREVAEAAANDRSLFLAVMSHEIRTPLNGVLGALDLVRQEPLSDNGRRYVNIATQSGEALLDLIDNVLIISKSENDQIQLAASPFCLQNLLSNVSDSLQSIVAKSGNTLTCEASAEARQSFLGDSARLRQVLVNLVSNANKFTQSGTISITATTVRSETGSCTFRISVRDTGIGIPADKHSLIFDRFRTLDASYSRRTDGTGLGLAICDKLVRAMGAHIQLESAIGKGSCFWFDLALPLAAKDNETPAPVSTETSSTIAPRKSVLLVEDNVTNAFVATQFMEEAGHTVRHAADGVQAVEMAQTMPFDVILMDISMPTMDGIEATALIRKIQGPNTSATIIALTAHAFGEDRERFLSIGMDGFLSKPIRRVALLAALDRLSIKEQGEPVAIKQNAGEIDLAALQEFIGERTPTSVEKTIGIYLREMSEKVADLARLTEQRDLHALKMLAHSVLGSSSMVGAARVVTLSRSIESACDSATDFDWASAAELADAMSRTIEVLGNYRAIKGVGLADRDDRAA